MISSYIIPLLVLVIILYAYFKKVDVYDEFIEGSKESFDMVLTMFPCMLAMIFGINIFLKSDILLFLFKIIKPFLSFVGVPFEIMPMAIMRPISGSSTLAILNNILKLYGPDSFIGRLACIIQGSTDTTLYVITLYFGSVGIKKIRYSLIVGLMADLIGIISSIIVVKLFFC